MMSTRDIFFVFSFGFIFLFFFSKRFDFIILTSFSLLMFDWCMISQSFVFLNSDSFYISAYNKKPFKHLKKIKPNIKILGSAHNFLEIRKKIEQGCDYIVLSRIFETSDRNKKGHLGTLKFNLLTRKFSERFIALGGINERRFKLLKMLNVFGCVMMSDKKKAGKYLPAFLKNNF